MGDGELYSLLPSTSENELNSALCSDTKGTFRRARWAERAFCDTGDDYVRAFSIRHFRVGIDIPAKFPGECASIPSKLGDLVDVVLAHMPERIFRLACLLPTSGMKLVQKYKRVTDELAGRLVAQHGDDDESLVSHLCA